MSLQPLFISRISLCGNGHFVRKVPHDLKRLAEAFLSVEQGGCRYSDGFQHIPIVADQQRQMCDDLRRQTVDI